jgi:transcriptional regulator with XRE-family HTH domain
MDQTREPDNIVKERALQALGKQINAIRTKKKLRQVEVARRCDINKSSYHNIENGKRNITILSLYKIARALETPVHKFFPDTK